MESDKNAVRVNHTTNTMTLSRLTIYTMYVINVSAVSSRGTGPANTAKARTDAEGVVVVYFGIKTKEYLFLQVERLSLFDYFELGT